MHGNRKSSAGCAGGPRFRAADLAVTVLTSLDQADLLDMGCLCTGELVFHRARRALERLSPHPGGRSLEGRVGDKLLVVTPDSPRGGRWADMAGATPRRPFGRADYLVIGSRQSNPISVTAGNNKEMEGRAVPCLMGIV